MQHCSSNCLSCPQYVKNRLQRK